uniref:Putative salivary kunitz domain protein n=1 Tax=Ixodes ricinus TaxID=34613 RepID=A0A0K8RK91_IXORI
MISVNMKIKYLCIFIAAAFGYPDCGPSEVKKDVCKMDPPTEPGRALIPGWFYNKSIDLCQYYVFGAISTENERTNRFSSLSDCSKTCRKHVPGFCFDTLRKGDQVEYPTKWTYDSVKGRCVKLYWKVEKTQNSNVFDNEGDCLDICRDKDFGPCAQLPTDMECTPNGTQYYRYDRARQICYLDSQYLCKGGDNAFLTLNDCYARCGRFVKNKCKLPAQDLGMCSQYGERFIFNPKKKKCEKYIGCDYHGIGFYNQSDCFNACEVDKKCIPDPNLHLCKETDDVFYRFNPSQKKCLLDNVNRCRGKNGFYNEEECEQRCAKRRSDGDSTGFDRTPTFLTPVMAQARK